MSFEEQYDAGYYSPTTSSMGGHAGMPPPFGGVAYAPYNQGSYRGGAVGGPASSTSPSAAVVATPVPSAHPAAMQREAPSGPYLRIVRASYGEGDRMVDVTDILQQRVFDRGGLTLDDFGPAPAARMNTVFGGDPSPGRDKQLVFSFEVVGSPKMLTKKEDMKMTLTMDHLYTKTMGKAMAPNETRHFCVNIIKATYGAAGNFYEVSSTLRIMVSEQGGKGVRAFGYSIKPNGCMNKAFGDPAPGKDKILTVEYSWRTPVLTYAIDEDKKVSLNFEPLRPLL